ncbi:xanthine dehydrogenase family protein molybdopterin-binding subunit [Chloroflexota bacterium]
MSEQFSVLGRRLPRNDALEKVKGEAKFVADIQLPGMLHAKFLRSPHAHARIVRIDTSKAERLAGVKAVLTYQNVPKVHPRRKLEYLLDETVHCAGEEVAVVAAVTKEIAEEALKLIEVEYEVLPAVFDAEEAMKPDAPLVYPEYGTNMFHGTEAQPVPRCRPDGWLPLEVGDVEKGFAQADHIIEGTYETPMQYHCSPMPRSVVCQWTGDKLTCWADTQLPMIVWQDLASCLGIPQSIVRVIATYPVGGYGGKEPERIATLAALLAKKTARPVRAVFTREEDFIATHRRLNFKAYEKIGVRKDGTITAMQHTMITNFGKDSAWAFRGPACAACYTCSMLYPCENSKWEGCTVITNTEQHAALNAFGDAEAAFCVERLIDEAAETIGVDPVEFRLKNCLRYGTRGAVSHFVYGGVAPGVRYGDTTFADWGIVGTDADSLQECIRKVAEKADWREKWKGWRSPVEISGTKRRGIGIAIGIHMSAYFPYSAYVKMNHDGTANVMSGATEIGQGCATAMAQVVAEALGLHYEDVNVLFADTAATPAGLGNVGSRGTSSAITAAKYAADNAKQKLLDIAAERLGVTSADLQAKRRRIYVKENPDIGMPIAEVCLLGYQVIGTAVNPPQESIIDEKTGKVISPCAFAATVAELEVDTETGALDVLRVTSAHDCGRAINPTIVENQIGLSVTMGNGSVRSENLIIDRSTGVVINPNLLDYKIMTILDMPKREDMQKIIVESPCAWGPFGAKGMSETAMTTQAPAIANAIYNAIGVRIRGDQLTPERILKALGK